MKKRKKRELLEFVYVGSLTVLACLLVVPSLHVSATVGKSNAHPQAATKKTPKRVIESWFQNQLAVTNKQAQAMVNQGKKVERIETFVAKSRTHMEKVSEQWRKQLERYTERLNRRLEEARDQAKKLADRRKKTKDGKKAKDDKKPAAPRSVAKKGDKAKKKDEGNVAKRAELKVERLPLHHAFAGIERNARTQFRAYAKTKKPHEGIERAHNEIKKRVQNKIKLIRKTLNASLERSKRGLDLTLRTVRAAIKRRKGK